MLNIAQRGLGLLQIGEHCIACLRKRTLPYSNDRTRQLGHKFCMVCIARLKLKRDISAIRKRAKTIEPNAAIDQCIQL